MENPTAADLLVGLTPMKAVTAEVPAGDGWGFEVKWDGMRVLAAVGATGDIATRSTRGLDVTGRFPELQELRAAVGGRAAVLDGEVVVLDGNGRADFGALQGRMHVEQPDRVRQLQASLPVTYVVFDLLELDGRSMRPLPYRDRRRLLTELVEPQAHVLVPGHQIGGGPELFRAAVASGIEGLMAKRLDSPYEPGRRGGAWRKCKVRRRQEVVIGGWAPGTGSRASTIGAVLVGVHDRSDDGLARPAPLRYAGRVGTGFTDDVLRDVLDRLTELETDRCPFAPEPPRADVRSVHWVQPELVAEVAFGEWTADGRLRHPSYLGLRIDKDPADVVREPTP